MYMCRPNLQIKGTWILFFKSVVPRLVFRMDQHQVFRLQSLRDALDDCFDKQLDVDDGKEKESEEVCRLEKTEKPPEKGYNDQEKKVPNSKKEEKAVKFSFATPEISNFRGNESQKRILTAKVRKLTA